MNRLAVWGVAIAGVLMTTTSLHAEPYMAVREGFRCNGCHTNITGGGKRTDIVIMHSSQLLHYPDFLGTFSAPTDAFTGEINKYVGIGGDLRTSYSAIFQDQPDAKGQVKNNTAFRSRLEQNTIDVTEAVGYLEARLIPEHLTLYIDQRVSPTTNNREAFGLLYGLPWGSFVKVGRMFLPYGLQLQDDRAFIRGGNNQSANTGFSFEQQQPAFELGIQPDPFSFIVAVSDGGSRDRDVQVSGTAMAMFTDLPIVRNVLLGGSFSRVAPAGSETVLVGGFAGTNLERLTLLGEADFRRDRNSTTNGQHLGTFIAYGEADYLLFDWLNVKATVDYADDDGDLTTRVDDSENRVSVGLEPFLNRFLQPRIFYRVGNGVRSNPTHNQDVLLAEIHLLL